MQHLLHAGVFLIFLLVLLVSLAFFWRYLPETRGRTFDEIASDLGNSEQNNSASESTSLIHPNTDK